MTGTDEDDLDALAPPPPATVTLAGRTVAVPPLTLARYVAARRVARRLGAALAEDDLVEALDADRTNLAQDFAAATGVEARVLEEADAAEALAALFVLVKAVRDFTAGPFAAALGAGVAALAATRATAPEPGPDGPTSSPGSSPAATPRAM